MVSSFVPTRILHFSHIYVQLSRAKNLHSTSNLCNLRGKARTTMKDFLLIVVISVLTLPTTSYEIISNTNELISAMQKKYGQSWYKTATFVQETRNVQPDGTSKVETWYEAMSLPGSLRIDFTPTTAGNGILFTDGKIFVFKDGKVETTRAFDHPLLIL